ncbi:terminase small subunit [Lacticaseibacillus chiayiensis]|uniref:terminase small subunit n=1 Tax=Lacticaseibacillus chiayiensis TaxID=2100821 RepID=UPI003C77E569
MRLTPKQRKFVDAYVESGDVKQATIDAECSKRTVRPIGQENLVNPDLKKPFKQV